MNAQPLAEVVGGVAEGLAWLLPVGPVAAPAAALPTAVEVAFSGAARGRVRVSLSAGTAREVARNMLGLEPGREPEPGDAIEAAKELANVLVGNLLPALYGAGREFAIAPPECAAPAPVRGDPVIALELAEGTLVVAVERG